MKMLVNRQESKLLVVSGSREAESPESVGGYQVPTPPKPTVNYIRLLS
ncbi:MULTISPECIES: hypothetical protein [unclassified Coleofasciculus]|nr:MULTISPECIES: hypothetical protein [unclassified Coleofasciculus]MBD1889571.1 hypothetical protein [Coleofasciculus sp. FACHB-SPT9]